jgi:hypothetical protein
MAFYMTARRSAALGLMLLISAGLSACTTTEGTNAFVDGNTFEREVIDPAVAGVGLIPEPDAKPDPTNARGPLVMPKDTSVLPAPQKDTVTAMLPADNTSPKINPAGLSQDEISRLKRVRVVDVNTPDGRPLTAAELQQLVGKMKGFTLNSKRSIFTPPEQYFTLASGQQDLVCLSKTGSLVSVNDPSCPVSIRNALLKKQG